MRSYPIQHPVKQAAMQTAALGLRGLLIATLWPVVLASRVVLRTPGFTDEA